MNLDLTIQNHQRTRQVNTRLLRQIVIALLDDLLEIRSAELGIMLVATAEMTRLNETFLQHKGSTDVITFDYSEPANPSPEVRGEIFVCVDEAIPQACRFRMTWQSEIVRYVVHGVLHLLGHNDHRAIVRRKMKQEESRLLRLLTERFPLSRLAGKPRLRR